MTDTTTNGNGKNGGISGAVGNFVRMSNLDDTTIKVKLAVLIYIVAALMVFAWMFFVFVLKATVDAGMAALVSGMVMLFIKMASDATGYQYSSSAGSDKKDDTSAKVNATLAEKVPAAIPVAAPPPPPAAPPVAPAPATPTQGPPWWDQLTDGEKVAIEAAANGPPLDTVISKFIATAKAGWATKADLVYLTSKGLLTEDRAKAIAP